MDGSDVRSQGKDVTGIATCNTSAIMNTAHQTPSYPNSQPHRRRRRRIGIPGLSMTFSSKGINKLELKHRSARNNNNNKMMKKTTTYLLMLFVVASISTLTTLLTHRSRVLSHRQWRMEHSHPLSSQHQKQQLQRRQLRSQIASATSKRPVTTSSSSRTGGKDTTDRFSPQSLHYLAFGSSITWGSKFLLQDDDDDDVQAISDDVTQLLEDVTSYPYLLDGQVYSVALPTGIMYADLAAACTQSLVDGTATKQNERPKELTTPDVITIEYTSIDISESHSVLIQRLRRRYPLAIVVVVQLLDPMMHFVLQEDLITTRQVTEYHHDDDISTTTKTSIPSKTVMTFQEWKNMYDHQLRTNDTMSLQNTTQQIRSKDDLWELARSMIQATIATPDQESQLHGNQNRRWTMEQASHRHPSRLFALLGSDPLILHFNQLSHHTTTSTAMDNVNVPIEQMKTFLNHFSIDAPSSDNSATTLLSLHGHEQVAIGIRTLVEAHMIDQMKQRKHWFHRSNFPHFVSKKIGDWGSGDDCHIWYTTGNYNIESMGGKPVNVPLIHSKDDSATTGLLLMNAMMNTINAPPHKHALEFSRSGASPYGSSSSIATSLAHDNNNYIVINNPFTTKRLLSLTYLTDSDGMSYPKTRVMLNDVPTVLLQPIHDHSIFNDNEVTSSQQLPVDTKQMAWTSGVGYVPPGKSIVRLIPLQATTFPFRLLGASLLAEEVQDLITIEFALEADTVPAPESVHF
jgi:hypothetical protein